LSSPPQLAPVGLMHNETAQLSGTQPALAHFCWTMVTMVSSSTNVVHAAPHPESFAGTAFAHGDPLPLLLLQDFAFVTASS
jgi:hypothetical protein